jgi:hypothetical protein
MLRPMRVLPVVALGLVAVALLGSCGERAPAYDVTIAFNQQYTEAALQEVDAILRAYDDDIDVLVQESFPPVARTVIHSKVENFCDELRAQLEVKPYVERVDCEERL